MIGTSGDGEPLVLVVAKGKRERRFHSCVSVWRAADRRFVRIGERLEDFFQLTERPISTKLRDDYDAYEARTRIAS